MEIFESMHEQGRTIILVTHEPEIAACASRQLLVRDGKITEATEASFFIYKDGVLWTHPENNFIHKNVVRRLLMERLSKDLDLQIIERAFDKDFALKADEAFLCGSSMGITSISQIDGIDVPNHEVTDKISDIYCNAVCGNNDRYQSWLTEIK